MNQAFDNTAKWFQDYIFPGEKIYFRNKNFWAIYSLFCAKHITLGVKTESCSWKWILKIESPLCSTVVECRTPVTRLKLKQSKCSGISHLIKGSSCLTVCILNGGENKKHLNNVLEWWYCPIFCIVHQTNKSSEHFINPQSFSALFRYHFACCMCSD